MYLVKHFETVQEIRSKHPITTLNKRHFAKGNDMETIIDGNETMTIASIPEYAQLRGVTTRTVQRWVKQNRITTLRRHDKTFVDVERSAELKKPTLDDEPMSATSTTLPTLSSDALLERLVNTLTEAAKQNGRATRHWQVASCALLLLFVISMVACSWLFSENRRQLDIVNSSEEMASFLLTNRNEAVSRASALEAELKTARSALDVARATQDKLREEINQHQLSNQTLASQAATANAAVEQLNQDLTEAQEKIKTLTVQLVSRQVLENRGQKR